VIIFSSRFRLDSESVRMKKHSERSSPGMLLQESERLTRTNRQSLIVLLLGISVLTCMFISISSVSSYAGHPLIVDDVGIVDAKACQLETWMDRRSESATYWVLPACNFTGNLELSVGAAWTYKSHSTRNTGVVLQGKTIFKPLETDGWGLGLVAGTLWHLKDNSNDRAYTLYANLPASFSFEDDRIIVHGNLGWNHDSAEKRSHLDWGIATEAAVTKSLYLFAEVFGQERGHPFFHFGFWYWVVPERMQVNAAYGNRFGTPSRGYWFSVGFSLFSVPFLP
jgi:hypothetical protein